MLLDASGVLAEQVVEHLLDAAGDRVGLALDYGLAPAGDSLVGVDTQEEPARFDEEEFESSDLHGVDLRVLCCVRPGAGRGAGRGG